MGQSSGDVGEGHVSRAQPGWASRAAGAQLGVVLGLLLARSWQRPQATLTHAAAGVVGWESLLWSL